MLGDMACTVVVIDLHEAIEGRVRSSSLVLDGRRDCVARVAGQRMGHLRQTHERADLPIGIVQTRVLVQVDVGVAAQPGGVRDGTHIDLLEDYFAVMALYQHGNLYLVIAKGTVALCDKILNAAYGVPQDCQVRAVDNVLHCSFLHCYDPAGFDPSQEWLGQLTLPVRPFCSSALRLPDLLFRVSILVTGSILAYAWSLPTSRLTTTGNLPNITRANARQ